VSLSRNNALNGAGENMNMSVIVTEEQITWLMQRHGIPELLRHEFEQLIGNDLNNSNYLDSVFYRYRFAIEALARANNVEMKPSHLVEVVDYEPEESDSKKG